MFEVGDLTFFEKINCVETLYQGCCKKQLLTLHALLSYEIVVVGSHLSGKSALVLAAAQQHFVDDHLPHDPYAVRKSVAVDGNTHMLNIYETACEGTPDEIDESFQSMHKASSI